MNSDKVTQKRAILFTTHSQHLDPPVFDLSNHPADYDVQISYIVCVQVTLIICTVGKEMRRK